MSDSLLRRMQNFRLITLVAMAFAFTVSGCHRASSLRFEGKAQGTTYHVTVVACEPKQTPHALQERVENRLAEIDRALSSYRDDSELNHVNQASIGEWISLSSDLYAVLQASRKISEQSEGAFDVTVAPLIDLWGFGRQRKEGIIPSDADIAQALALVDYRQLEIDAGQSRAKKHTTLKVDINGIAQGYTVDQLAQVLSASGCVDYLIEVGGELRLSGHNAEQKLWRIGIETPADGFGGIEQAVSATNVGMTTAGDYHDYFEKEGVRYSHTIDPRTGKPVTHKLASVTVIAVDAIVADGLDTALEVMGPDAGYDFAQKNNIAAFFVVREGDYFVTRYTSRMKQYLAN